MTRTTILSAAAVAFAGALALAPTQVLAAHAGAPYTNVDHRNDAGNNTGDSQVDSLNDAQLDQNYWATHPRTTQAMPYPAPSYGKGPASGYGQPQSYNATMTPAQ